MQNVEKLETTLGELIVALTDEATQLVCDEKEVNKLVASALMHLLCTQGKQFEC